MARIDDAAFYNPFGWRLAELAEPVTGPHRRSELIEELMAWEAEELAHGYRHLTIEHRDPDKLDASRLLSALYDRMGALADRSPWARIRGAVDYVTVTVHGLEADDAIGSFMAIAEQLNAGGWTVAPTACPPSIVGA